MKNFFGSIFINRDELREAGIEYPIKVEYYKITNEIPSRQKLIFGIQVIKKRLHNLFQDHGGAVNSLYTSRS